MAFADPQSVTINAVANTLPRTSSDHNAGTFSKDDGTVVLNVGHQYGKRARRVLKLQHSKTISDPVISGNYVKTSITVSLVVDAPLVGYSVAEAKQIVDALTAYATASSGARVTQLLGGEN